jgi:alpha-L-rhamnosidase
MFSGPATGNVGPMGSGIQEVCVVGEVRRRVVLGGMAGAAALTAMPVAARGNGDPMRPVGLTAEHVVNPLGIDAVAPRLGWRLEAGGVDRAQSAYQIMVASTPELLRHGRPDVWDSGKVASARQSAIPYAGPPLRSRTRYHWAVQVWDESGRRGPRSDPVWFETALLSEGEWTAQWVGSGIVIPPPVRTLGPQPFGETALTPGLTLGQSFLSPSRLVAVAVLLTVAGPEPAGCVLTLRRDGPNGVVLGRQVVSGLTADRHGNAHGRLDLLEPVGPGKLFLELSEPRGRLGWVGVPHEAYDDGEAYVNGSTDDVAGDRWVYGIPPDPPADPLLRTEFDLTAPVASARLHLSGLGHAVAWVNGRRVGDAELSPATTDYDRRVLYTTHDVTELLRRGGNALGIALGRGYFATRAPDSESSSNLARWIAEPQVLAQLEVTLANDQRVTVGTDSEWRLTEGPITFDGLYTGESYDARRAAQLDGWTLPGFRADGWRPVAVVPSPGGRLEAYSGEPVRAGEAVEPARVSQPADGVWLYDFGVVLAGWARLRGQLPAGTTVRMLYSEKLGASGRIEVGTPGGNENPSVGGRYQVDEYTAHGHGTESWQPSFTYKGFRYLEVSGTTEPPDIVAVPVGSDLASAMDLGLDQPVLQWIADAVRQTARNCLRGQPDISPMFTKLGWTSGSYRAAQSMLYLFGMASVFGKWLDDLRLSQAPDGEIPLIAPVGFTTNGGLVTPSSTGVYPYLVRRYWLTYGDRTVPDKHFDSVRRYVEWLLAKVSDEVADEPFGDWYPPRPGRPTDDPPAPEGGELVSKAYTIQTLRDSAELAELVGRDDLAAAWRVEEEQLVRQFNEVFLDPVQDVYRTDIPTGYRQTSNAVPLVFGLVPAGHVAPVAANLAANVEAQGRHLDTGHLGTGALPIALSDHGRADLAHAVLAQRSYPSFGHLRDLGATTLWESWEPDSRGHNDPALSLPMLWFVERVLGVEALSPGWARFRVAPRAFGPLPAASLSLDTVRGRITVAWRQSAGAVTLDLRVPVNAVAELTLPDGTRRDLGSGTHRFVTELVSDRVGGR